MQRIPLFLTLLTLTFLAACAASRPAATDANLAVVPNPAKRLHTLTVRLHLSAEQADAIRPILEDAYAKKIALHERQEQDPNGKNRQAEENLDWATIKALAPHLTREQMNAYCNLLDEEAKVQTGKPGAGRGGPGGLGGGSGSGGPGRPGGGF